MMTLSKCHLLKAKKKKKKKTKNQKKKNKKTQKNQVKNFIISDAYKYNVAELYNLLPDVVERDEV